MNIQAISTSLPPQSSSDAGAVSRAATAVPPPVQQSAPPEQPASKEQLEAAVSSLREYIQPFNSDLQFSVNNDTNQVVVTVIDSQTKEVIRQIPSEEMIAIAKTLDSIKGLFLKQSA